MKTRKPKKPINLEQLLDDPTLKAERDEFELCIQTGKVFEKIKLMELEELYQMFKRRFLREYPQSMEVVQ